MEIVCFSALKKPPAFAKGSYFQFPLFYFLAAGLAAAAGAALPAAGAAAAGAALPAAGAAAAVSSWRSARVVTTDATGIRGELSISIFSAITS